MITTIIFDMGYVLNTIHIQKFYEEVLRIPKDEVKKHQVEREWGRKLATSEISLETYFEKVSAHYNIHFSLEDYLKKLNTYVEWNFPLFEFITNELKDSYCLVIFSNNSELFITKQLREDLSSLFTYQVYSCDIRCRKPEKKAYHKLLDQIHTKPESCLFIDDREQNLLPARKLGMKTHQYTSLLKLKKELVALGLIEKKD